MTPHEFVSNWRGVELKERSASQTHFNQLCALLGIVDPVTADPKGEWFTFEKGATKATGSEGWADVWRKGCFAWEYKGKHANLQKAFAQLLQYSVALENPPLWFHRHPDCVDPYKAILDWARRNRPSVGTAVRRRPLHFCRNVRNEYDRGLER